MCTFYKALSIFTLCTVLSNLHGQNFWTEDFSIFNSAQYYTAGNAYYDATNQYFILTPPTNENRGRIFYKTLFPIAQFVANFDIKIGGGSGGDGIVFAFVEDYTYPAGIGGRLDFWEASGYGVEFDTWDNGEFGDPSEEHIAIVHNSANNHLSFYIAPNGEIEDNQWHQVFVQFSLGQIKVYLDGALKLDYLIPNFQIFNGYFGFTAATGVANNWQIIDNIMVSSQGGVVILSCPNGGEFWEVGNSYNITWNSINISQVNLEFSIDGGSTWMPIASNIPAESGSYTWIIPNTPSQNCLVRISDASNPSTFDISNNVFTITLDALNEGLVAYYPFNGNANDESPNNNDGTVFGAVLTEDRLGNPNSAYLFDGIDDYIDIGNHSSLKPVLPVTFTAWVKNNQIGATVSNPYFTNDFHTTRYYGVWFNTNPTGQVMSNYGDGDDIIDPASRRSKISNTILSEGIWYHVAGVIRGPLDMDIYINGVNDGGIYEGSGSALNYSNGSGSIGRKDFSTFDPTTYFNGVIDEICFYNRALSETEIQDIYSGGLNNSIILTAPNGGETWQVGTVPSITWFSTGIPNVKIEYSTNGGATWELPIVDSYPAGNQSFSWTIPNTPSLYCLVKISDANDPSVFDISDQAFKIISSIIPLEGLIAYYPFNGNANDESLDNNDGTVFGAVLTEDRLGNPHSAYLFDGINDYIDIGNHSSLKPVLPVTFTAWVKNNQIGPVAHNPYFTNDFHTTRYYGVWFYTNATGQVVINYGDGGDIDPASRRSKTSNTILSEGIWYHVAGVIRGPLDMDIYINGVNDGGTYEGSGSALTYSTGSGNIGRKDFSSFNPSTYFNGAIDEICFYNRALSESEIQDIYSGGFNSSIILTAPNGGETWQVGSQQNITWTSTGVTNVKIEYSSNAGATWEPPIVNLYPASNQSYEWTVPNVTSDECLIRISDVLNPGIIDDSEQFILRGYSLVRFNVNGTMEKYEIGIHNWSAPNNSIYIWPFNHGINCIGDEVIWCGILRLCEDAIPTWELFAEAFGDDAVYEWVNGEKIRKKGAENFWKINRRCWDGSCYGFAISSFLSFDDKVAFLTRFPNIGNFENLYDIEIPANPNGGVAARNAINVLWVHQFGKVARGIINRDQKTKTPNSVLNEIKNMFLNDTRNDKGLNLFHQNGKSGRHTVNPYRIEIDPDNNTIQKIYVYDSDSPDKNDAIITIHMSEGEDGRWEYSEKPDWGGEHGLFLTDPVRNYLNYAILLNSSQSENKVNLMTHNNLDNYISIYKSRYTDILIHDPNGNTTSYIDSLLTEEIENSLPIIPITGTLTEPLGFYLPESLEYDVSIFNFLDSIASFSVYDSSTIFTYERDDAENTQVDNFFYSNGLSILNPDNFTKQISLSVIHVDSIYEKYYLLGNVNLAYNDSVKVNLDNQQALKLSQDGLEKNYDLYIEILGNGLLAKISRDNITLPANSSHLIVPDWNNFSSQTIQILVDSLNDGTIDDTLQGVFFNSYTIVTVAGPNGSIIYAGTGTSIDTVIVYHGDSANFVIMPDSGYTIQDVLIDGVSVGPVPNYTFTNITADHTISASFTPTCTPGLLGDITGDGATNSTDGLVLLSYDAGFPLPQPFLDRIAIGFGDVNEDNLTNSTDALITLSWEAGFPVPFPVGQPVCLPANSRTATLPTKNASLPAGLSGLNHPGLTASKMGLNKGGATIHASAAPTNAQLLTGQTIEVPLMVDMGSLEEKLGSYTVTLQWNPTVLQFEDYRGGSAVGFENPVVNTAETANGKLIAAHAYPQGSAGAVNVLNLQFKVVGAPGANPGLSLNFTALAAARTFTDLLPYLELSENLLSVEALPTEYAIANYPNPFNATTEIHYQLPEAVKVEIVLYNVLGQKIRVLVNRWQEAGRYRLTWNGDSEQGQMLPSGIFFLRMRAGKFVADRKLLLLK